MKTSEDDVRAAFLAGFEDGVSYPNLNHDEQQKQFVIWWRKREDEFIRKYVEHEDHVYDVSMYTQDQLVMAVGAHVLRWGHVKTDVGGTITHVDFRAQVTQEQKGTA